MFGCIDDGFRNRLSHGIAGDSLRRRFFELQRLCRVRLGRGIFNRFGRLSRLFLGNILTDDTRYKISRSYAGFGLLGRFLRRAESNLAPFSLPF